MEPSREQLIQAFAEHVASKMDIETLRQIAAITLVANIDPNSTLEQWQEYTSNTEGLETSEELLELIQPSVVMKPATRQADLRDTPGGAVGYR